MPIFSALLTLFASSSADVNQPLSEPTFWSAEKIKAMDPRDVPRTLLGDFGRELVLNVNYPGYQLLGLPLLDLHFLSLPRWSYNPGLCESTEVVVSFQRAYPAGRVRVGEELTRPTAVTARPSYILLDESKVQPRGTATTDAERSQQQTRCSKIDPLLAHRIRASSPWEVSDALRHLGSLVAQARSGRITGELNCDPVGASGWPAITKEQCTQMLARFTPTKIDYVWACQPPNPRCLQMNTEGYLIDVVTNEKMRAIEFRVGRIPPPPPLV